MSSLPLALLAIGGSIALALLALVAVRRFVPIEALEQNMIVATTKIQVIGTIYAVLLAFVVFVVWNSHDGADQAATREALNLLDVDRLAGGFDEPARGELRALTRRYARAVLDEWPQLARGYPSGDGQPALDALWQAVVRIEPRSERERVLYHELVQRVRALGDDRRDRLLAATTDIPSVLWLVLIGGACLVILFTALLHSRQMLNQAVMAAALAALIGAILFLIATLDQPFAGAAGLAPTSFRQALDYFEQRR